MAVASAGSQPHIASARDCVEHQLEVADPLELGSLTAPPPSVFFPFPFSLTLLAWSSFPGGDDCASGSASRHVFAQPFAGDQHPPGPGMPAPSLCSCCARRSTPIPNRTICIRIRSSYNISPTSFDFVCKNYRGPMLGPPPGWGARGGASITEETHVLSCFFQQDMCNLHC